jgi:hypothetical protein
MRERVRLKVECSSRERLGGRKTWRPCSWESEYDVEGGKLKVDGGGLSEKTNEGCTSEDVELMKS